MDTITAVDDQTLGWMIVEQLGHRKIAGHVREVEIAGAGFLRVDIPTPDGTERTVYASPSSVYALHPVDQALATTVAARCHPQPVHPWEFRELAPAPPRTMDDYDQDDDEDDLVTTVQPRGDVL